MGILSLHRTLEVLIIYFQFRCQEKACRRKDQVQKDEEREWKNPHNTGESAQVHVVDMFLGLPIFYEKIIYEA